MRVVFSVMFGSLLALSMSSEVSAKEPTHAFKNLSELAETVSQLLPRNCTLVSDHSSSDANARHLVMTFRYRCSGTKNEASTLLNALELGGFTVDAVNELGLNPATGQPSVDVRFHAVALADGVDGDRN